MAGTCDGVEFEDLRDLDDLMAPLFEVLTSNGKYYWVPIEQVELIEFRPVVRPRDLLWRRVRMVVKDGPDGEVYFHPLRRIASIQRRSPSLGPHDRLAGW